MPAHKFSPQPCFAKASRALLACTFSNVLNSDPALFCVLPDFVPLQVFCPRCEDIFYPRSEYQCSIDGAYYGTTFPHLMLMTYPMYRPPKAVETYVPRVFGFKLHPTAYANRETAPSRSSQRRVTAAAEQGELSRQRSGTAGTAGTGAGGNGNNGGNGNEL